MAPNAPARRGDFLKSVAIQRRVVHALLMREVLTRYGRHNIGFLWLFVEPMIFTLGVAAIWTATRNVHGSSLPIIAFAITGYSSVLLWRNMPGRCLMAINPNLSLMYHRQVRVIDIFLARILLEGIGATISFVVLCLFFTFIGSMSLPEDVLMVVGGWLMLAWFGASLALLLGALSESWEAIDKIWHPVSYLLFPLSGAAFTVDALPKVAQDIILILPMVHGVEFLREGYFGAAFHAHYDMTYMALVNLGMTLLALARTRTVGRKLIPQ